MFKRKELIRKLIGQGKVRKAKTGYWINPTLQDALDAIREIGQTRPFKVQDILNHMREKGYYARSPIVKSAMNCLESEKEICPKNKIIRVYFNLIIN